MCTGKHKEAGENLPCLRGIAGVCIAAARAHLPPRLERGLSVRIEPELGGRFIEVYDLDTGTGYEVGRVTAWEPGVRLALTWTQIGWPDGVATDLEITFEPARDGTLVRLAQTGFERVGPEAERFRDGYALGWQEVLGWFAERINAKEQR